MAQVDKYRFEYRSTKCVRQVDTTAPRASRTRISMGASGDGGSSQGQTSKAQLDANRKALVEAQVRGVDLDVLKIIGLICFSITD